ncbi:hypothetical protein ES319_A09G040600v1 [Gossypium barbadense]|uniref:Uncharacterized protein n=1 Tax=Gossypium barbadense TaxID=3634 RepID=A0A5J5U9P1_GOSBA|nr:hypothetical protein ES319_A09G040600v1 [Gossypium barbadense]
MKDISVLVDHSYLVISPRILDCFPMFQYQERICDEIRSHAQKYFLKVQKNGTNEHLPPPRPKRKATHPYPQKASKTGLRLTNNSCSSSEDTLKTRQIEEITDQRNTGHALRVLPDFAQVYSFIGSVFDPKATGHLQKLKKMDPLDVETVLLLMRNLAINLASPDFEDHRRLLSSYDVDMDTSDGSACKAVDKEQSKSITYNSR